MTFTGNTCEMIVERVDDCIVYCRLSGWNNVMAQTLDCLDGGELNVWNISTDPFLSITMKNSSGQAMVAPSTDNPDWTGVDWLRAQ